MTAAYGFIKLSIIFFYRRVFIVQRSDWMNIATHVFTGVVVAWTLAYIFAIAFSCGTHWSAHWTSYAAMFEHCNGGYPIQHIVESLLITDLILDVLIVALPIPRVSQQQRPHPEFVPAVVTLTNFRSGLCTFRR